MIYDFIYDYRREWERFISISLIAKSRVYEDYLFLPLNGWDAVCESGRQSILGVCAYMGTEKESKKFSFRFYCGTGIRFSWNDVQWEKQARASNEISGEDKQFTRRLILPSIDGGIIFYFKAGGN